MARLSTLAVLAALASAAPESPSEQIHLSLTPERGSMAVSFVVRDWNCPTGTTRSVAWAVANDVEPVPTLSNTATVNGVSYSDSGETLCLFDGVLSGLPANTRVFYRPESATTT